MRVRYSFSSRRTGHTENMTRQKAKVPDIINRIISDSDVVLEILDARFIEETRNPEIEKLIESQGKTLIYVINKADLVDIKQIKEKLESLKPYSIVSCTARRGKKELITRIRIEIKKFNKDRAYVGVIGYPNTGKSSLINYLTGRNAAKTAQQAGFTQGVQKVRLVPGILLLDSPGIIPENENSTTSQKDLVKHAKIDVRTYDKVKDPEFLVSSLMKEYPGVFEKFYKISADGNAEILIQELGKRRNLLIRGGEIDFDKTSRVILRDWQQGKIRVKSSQL